MTLLVLQFIALFSLVTLGFYVFAVDPRRRANQAFAAFNGLLALWTVRDILFWNFEEFRQYQELWLIIGTLSACLMLIALVIFAEDFPIEPDRFPKSSAAIISPSFILLPACGLGLFWNSFEILDSGVDLELSISGYFFATYLAVLFIWGFSRLLLKAYHEKNSETKKQLMTVIAGLALTAILILFSSMILPIFGETSWLPLSSVFAIPGVILNAFAILNFRLFSLQSALDEIRHFPIAHKVAFTVAGIAVSSFVILQLPIALWSFKDGFGEGAWIRYITLSLLAALPPNLLLVLAVVRTVSRPLKRLTVAALETSKGRYGIEVEGRTTNDEIGILTDAYNKMTKKMASDLAILKRMNDRLMRTEKLASIGTLSAGIAHEISNPLAAVSSIVETLRRNPHIDAESAARLEIVAAQLRRVSTITREMLEFAASKPERRVGTDINEIVMSSLRLVGFDSGFRDIQIETRLGEGNRRVECDPDQIQQVLVNLLLNARDAIKQDGMIIVTTHYSDAEIAIEIQDNGCGINEDDLSRIFDPFFTTKGDKGGTGLGLAVSYGIVEGHGGRLEAVACEPVGTILRVTLPSAD